MEFVSSIDDARFNSTLNRMETGINRFSGNLQEQGNSIQSLMNKASIAAAGFFSIQAASGFIQSLVQTRGEMQQLEVAFNTMLGSKEKADKLMAENVRLAAVTPFTLQDVASGSKQLLAYGFAAGDVTKNLEMLGNIASGVGSQLSDVTYLYGTLRASGRVTQVDINQFAGRGIPIYEALAKVMSINVAQVRDYVSAGKIGFPQVEQAFKNLTSSGGMFFNLMQEQSKTLTGQLSNLEDAWSRMLNDIGKENEGLFASAIGSAITLVDNYQKVLDILGSLIVSYGVYRAALIANTVITTLATASQIGMTAAQINGIFWTETLQKAVKLLNATLAINPYVAVATAIAALTSYMYLASEETNKLKTSTSLYNEALNKQGDQADTTIAKLNVYLQTLKNQNISEGQRLSIYEKIKAIDPKILDGIDAKAISYINLKAKVDDYITSLRNKFRVEAQEGAIKSSIENENLIKQDVDKLKSYTDEYLKAFNLTRKDLEEGIKKIPNPVLDKYANEQKAMDLLLKQQIETSKLVGKSIQNGSKSEIDGVINDIKILEAQKKKYASESAEYIELKSQISQKEDELTNLRKLKAASTTTPKVEVVKNKAFYEAIIKQNTDDLEALDRGAADFNAKAAPLKKKISEAKASLLSFDASGKADKADLESAKRKADIVSKLYELNEKYNNQTLTGDQQKLAEIRSDFKKLQDEIDTYNNNPKNTKFNPNLKPELEKALSNQEYISGTEKLKVYLDEQKRLYDDYEAYKTTLGKDAADKRFKLELDTSLSFLEELTIRENELLSKGKANLTVPEADRLADIQKRKKDEIESEKQKHDELVKEFISYSDKRKVLIEQYNIRFKELQNDPGAQVNLTKIHEEELKNLGFSNLKKLESYETLFKGIDKLSEASALKQLQTARNTFDQDILHNRITDPAEIEKIKNYFNQIERTIKQGSGKALQNLGSEISQVANEAGNLNKVFGTVLSTLGNVVSKVGEIKTGLKDFNKAKEDGNGFGQLRAGLGIFGAGISILSTVIKMFDKSAEREAQASYSRELQNKQQDALNKALERQVALINDAYGTDRIDKYTAAMQLANENQIKYQDALAGKYKTTGDAMTDSYLKQINDGVDPKKVKGGTFFQQNDFLNAYYDGKFQQIGDLSKLTIEQLKDLKEGGPLDEGSQKLLDNLIQAKQTLIDLANSQAIDRIGASLSTIVDDFISTLTDGVQDFGGSFEKIIRRALLNGLKGEITQKFLQQFYADLDEALKDGNISSEEDKKLRDLYNAAEKYGKEKLDYIDSIAPDESSADNSSSLNKSIRQITSDQANALEGIERGTYDLTKQILGQSIEQTSVIRILNQSNLEALALTKASMSHFNDIAANTLRTANNTDRLKAMEDSLSVIAKNSASSGSSIRGGGYAG